MFQMKRFIELERSPLSMLGKEPFSMEVLVPETGQTGVFEG